MVYGSRLDLPPIFDTTAHWNTLYREVETIVGKRAANLLGYGIAAVVGSAACMAFFRDFFITAGEDPENIALNGAEDDLLAFGETIARNNGKTSYELFESLSPYYTTAELVILVTFAGQVIASGIFSNAFNIDGVDGLFQ